MIPLYFGISLACVAYVHRKDGMECSNVVYVLGLVVAQGILAVILYFAYGIVLGVFGLLPSGGGEIASDSLYVVLGSITSIWSLLIVNFGYLIRSRGVHYA